MARGLVVPMGSRVLRWAAAPQTWEQEVMAGCIDVGGPATERTAAAWHGLGRFPRAGKPAVLALDGRQSTRSTLARVHTTTWLPPDDVLVIDSVPVLSVARTIFSLAAIAPEIGIDVVADVIDGAVRDRKATDAWLWWQLERTRRRGRNGVKVLEDILQRRSGGQVTESWLERAFLRLLRDAGLPLPACQQRIEADGAFVARVDFKYPWLAPVIEVSGYTSHSTERQVRRDVRRRSELTLVGHAVVEFTYDDVVTDPAYVVGTVRRLLGGAVAA